MVRYFENEGEMREAFKGVVMILDKKQALEEVDSMEYKISELKKRYHLDTSAIYDYYMDD